MTIQMNKREVAQLLVQPNIAVVAVTAPDGSPHAVPTWYEYRKGEVAFITDSTAFKYKCLVNDPRITFCVDTRKPPYKAVILKGRATMEEKRVPAMVERMAIAYMGQKAGRAYVSAFKNDPVVVVRFKPERVISWDYAKDE
jgi:PPOX class probable F420-dependent enzyme